MARTRFPQQESYESLYRKKCRELRAAKHAIKKLRASNIRLQYYLMKQEFEKNLTSDYEEVSLNDIDLNEEVSLNDIDLNDDELSCSPENHED